LVYCYNCGKKNIDTADYCFVCGTRITPYDEDSFNKRIDDWGEEIGQTAERFGKKVEEVALRVHDKVLGTQNHDAKNSKDTKNVMEQQEAKYCIKCGKKYSGDPNYCNKCGNKI
jgi:uncharacterized membrane protein YvbJ